MRSVRTQVYFTESQRRSLDVIAEREGRTMAEVVREATAAYLARDAGSVELPPELVTRLATQAAVGGTDPAELAVSLLDEALRMREAPAPTLPLFDSGWGAGDDAERIDEILDEGFGRS